MYKPHGNQDSIDHGTVSKPQPSASALAKGNSVFGGHFPWANPACIYNMRHNNKQHGCIFHPQFNPGQGRDNSSVRSLLSGCLAFSSTAFTRMTAIYYEETEGQRCPATPPLAWGNILPESINRYFTFPQLITSRRSSYTSQQFFLSSSVLSIGNFLSFYSFETTQLI